ncbi:AtpZ/AtpI family protein [Luteipulveratus sp. YIM 133132]|uniref:AtpZ/AtpI family protein n=1 Tax=Luteipulveratus flavus TaxID=3031728 RepID=A0ABT6C866_9MICO|nr:MULTISPECIES: AtpZ/AtpI family protein [unclassified Luteipulveratus]MDE9365939.1 AtpZ/AtpI family protein [Luteipulveratus sp. YIM 133132]MDF8265129.1 AtpZ/AtpI family protein [Luteipulveratus sp. YIM 133296]
MSTPAPHDPADSRPAYTGRSETREYREAPIPESVAWTVTAHLISGPVLYGGIGLLLDHWFGTSFLVVIGILGGMALSMYLIWVRYGSS